MQTEVELIRKFGNGEIRQKSKSAFLCATDLVKVANDFRREKGLSDFNERVWFQSKGTKEFIAELEAQTGEPAIIKGRGRCSATWVHPYLFIDLALAINPKFKVEVYGWLYDELLKYRNSSGDSFKKMCGAIQIRIDNQRKLVPELQSICRRIRKECGVNENMNDKEAWNKATEKQLELRDKIHEYIAQFSDIIQGENLYDIAIKKAKEEVNA